MARQVKHRDTQQLTTMEQTYEGFFTDFDEDCVDQYKAEETSQSEQTLPTTRRPTIWDRAVDGILLRSECLVWPDSRFRRTWDIILLLLILYQAVTVPLLLAFPYIHLSKGYELFEDVMTMFFLLDVLANFCTGYQKPNGVIEMDAKHVALHYLKGWFLLDLVASFPYSWIITAAAGSDSAASRGPNLLRIIRLGRITRGLKLVRLLKIKSVMDEVSASFAGALVESFAMTIIGMGKLSILLLIAHWNACAFGMLGWELYRSGAENWIYRLEEIRGEYPTELVTLYQRACTDGDPAELMATPYTNWDE
ncbi:voltage and ligand gated potassium channel, putative [Perkinsus marinus ATCC 50983]|uniref:Voltage and ligand gated potassium channel, putative n=1 Tax=Perkinsus marinus (strain ATCC 50983 / TXsc) TaxID=423536 RepID=C5KI26_PERM5|nr:voltage and ligand gated potassium channel, putative [Perkinsus marinus ATCC 50983]EER16238.1 voltage and ligand gated potassium channel, putative [Perkinsus marinus ATCC 50983]|eukprot:XP_002784442.1 voltage and ligand gated potassium channel, putative [Perkinsus marinus ATCC 50983]